MPMLANSPNHFLSSLPPTDADLLRSHLRPMNVPQGTFIYKAEDSIGQVYFPQTGVISLIVGLTSGQFVEAGMLGRNGVIGAGAPARRSDCAQLGHCAGGKFGLSD